MYPRRLHALCSALWFACLFLAPTRVSRAEASESGADVSASFLPDGSGGLSRGAETLGTFEMMLRVIGSLIIIIVIFILIMKVLSQKNRRWMSGRTVRTLGGVMLGQNKSVQLVEIGRSIYIIGVGEDVRLLDKIDDPQEAALIAQAYAAETDAFSAGKRFGKWLGALRGRGEKPPEDDFASSFQELFHEKMRQLSNRNRMLEDMLHDEDSRNRSHDRSHDK